jgi:hypothetical protein
MYPGLVSLMKVLCGNYELCERWVNISRRPACSIYREVLRVTFKLLDVKLTSSILSSTSVLFDVVVRLILRTVVRTFSP